MEGADSANTMTLSDWTQMVSLIVAIISAIFAGIPYFKSLSPEALRATRTGAISVSLLAIGYTLGNVMPVKAGMQDETTKYMNSGGDGSPSGPIFGSGMSLAERQFNYFDAPNVPMDEPLMAYPNRKKLPRSDQSIERVLPKSKDGSIDKYTAP